MKFWNKDEWQGRSKEQVESYYRNIGTVATIAVLSFCLISFIISIWHILYFMQNLQPKSLVGNLKIIFIYMIG
jgi:predicted neutral ceramidase superfamily lipid hydrolase